MNWAVHALTSGNKMLSMSFMTTAMYCHHISLLQTQLLLYSKHAVSKFIQNGAITITEVKECKSSLWGVCVPHMRGLCCSWMHKTAVRICPVMLGSVKSTS